MADADSSLLQNWIPEALNGNIDYFKQLKKCRMLYQCRDKYGMTPLMYAVLGKGCFDTNVLSEFAKLSKKSDRNCLGHTACDIYICIAGSAVFSDDKYRNIFNILDPSNSAGREAAKNTAADLAVGLLGAGAAVFAALAYMGADSAQRTNMDAAYRRNSEQARFSSHGTESVLKNRTADSDFYREKYTSKFCAEQSARLSHLEEQLASKEEELANLQTELENVNQNGDEIFREQRQKYKEERLTAYRKEREEQYQRLLNTEGKDEFETQAEYQKRIDRIMDRQYGPEASDDELLEITGKDLPVIKARVEEILDQRKREAKAGLDKCEQDIQTLGLQLDLLSIYAFPFSGEAGAYISLGAYDAESECFTLHTCRYETLVHIPRETAKIIRQDLDSYEIQFDCGYENPDYYAAFIIQTAGQSFVSEEIQCRLLSWDGIADT